MNEAATAQEETPLVQQALDPLGCNSPSSPNEDTSDDDERQQEEVQEQRPEQLEESTQDRSEVANLHSSLSLPSSLAFSSVSPILRYGIPILILATHALFYYGQTATQWRVVGTQSERLSVWINSTTTESKWALQALGYSDGSVQLTLDPAANSSYPYVYQMRTNSLKQNIQDLWKHDGTKTLSTEAIVSQASAVFLAVCSGLWPHVKLLLLQLCWWWSCRATKRREQVLDTIAVLGKWSLVDVIVVALFIVLVDLEWLVEPNVVKAQIRQHMELLVELLRKEYGPKYLCGSLLGYSCYHPSKFHHKTQCNACVRLILQAYNHPGWCQHRGREILDGLQVTSVSRTASRLSLHFVAARGLYAFGAAVLLSILASIVVDFCHKRRRLQNAGVETREPLISLGDNGQSDEMDEGNQNQSHQFNWSPLLSLTRGHHRRRIPDWHDDDDAVSYDDSSYLERSLLHPRRRNWWTETLLGTTIPATVTFLLVCVALFLPVVYQQCGGALPVLMENFAGVSWNRPHSLWHVIAATRQNVGLLLVLAIFLAIGPVVRAGLVVWHSVGRRFRARETKLLHSLKIAIETTGALCAWEVVLMAVLEVHILLPSLTKTIYHDTACRHASADGACFTMSLQLQKTLLFVLFSCVALAWVARKVSSKQSAHAHGYYFMMDPQSENSAEVRLLADG